MRRSVYVRVVTYEALRLDASAEAERARHIKHPQRLHLMCTTITQYYRTHYYKTRGRGSSGVAGLPGLYTSSRVPRLSTCVCRLARVSRLSLSLSVLGQGQEVVCVTA